MELECNAISIQDWLNSKLAEIAKKLPKAVENNPASFDCGLQMGYKLALLDLDIIIEDGGFVHRTLCKCGDKYHAAGFICL